MFGNFMRWLLGTQKSSRDHIVNLKLTIRRLERAQRKLERDESRIQLKMRTAIQRGDLEGARLYATDIVRSRKWVLGYQRLVSRINGLIFKLERADSAANLAAEMHSIAGALRQANAQLNVPDLDHVIQDMERSIDGIEDSTETIEDGIDDLLIADTDPAEVDRLIDQTATEMGVSVGGELPSVSAVATDDLEEEIQKLRKKE
ncbi:MAG: SNF7 family protein [Candidatus Heimdallarchaeum aukensis]|uniref:SNF7 family protein n=1 Tax=Candidatus Heimdallarchaeum aukensis TaxID=2876573 RepID=A0A9Y1BPU0_9ARCH|nr:MAG: SNF7 family protein [Candidatus Heimdallarchaeum aukensis]